MSRAFASPGDPEIRLEMGDEENAITQDLLESDLEQDADAPGNDGFIETPFLGSQQRSKVPEPPEWLSDRHGPFHDIATTRRGLAINDNHAQENMRNTMIDDEARRQPKLSRSFKRPGAARVRRLPWICLDDEGRRSVMHADKRAIIAKTGLHIPIRDMRLLDFNLVAVDSTILVRDNAIIASMYHVRLIVTADSVIIPRDIVERDVVAARFVDALQDSIVYWARQRREFQRQQEQEHLQPNEDTKTAEPMAKPFSSLNSPPRDGDDSCSGSVIRHEGPPLAFELVVLEAALKEVVGSMSLQIKELEGIAFPALDALTKAINTSNLERVRKVKTRHQRLILRTEALRDELQRFLQDDEDMARMCLSRRKEVEEAAKAAAESYGGEGIEGERTPSFHFAPGSLVRRSSLPFGGRQAATSSPPGGMSMLPSREYFTTNGQTTLSTANYTTAPVPYSNEDELDAEAQQEVENLLESYYMQVDGLYDKLVSVEEYIKDTEEYINIELDSSRNRLIRMEIVLAVATFAIMPFNLMAGILGENLIIPEQITGSVSQFYGVNVIAGAICLSIFYIIILYMRYTKLI